MKNKLELILIEEQDNLRFEIQVARSKNTIGPFIRNRALINKLDTQLPEKQNEVAKILKLVSPFLDFPINVELSHDNCSFFYKKAKNANVKLYSLTKNSSLKKTKYRIIEDIQLFESLVNSNIIEIVIYTEFSLSYVLANVFVKVEGSSRLYPLDTHFKKHLEQKFPLLDNCIYKYYKENIWKMSDIDFNALFYSSKKYLKDGTFKILTKIGNKKTKNTTFQKSRYDIDWLDSSNSDLENVINDRIITNYIKNKQYSYFEGLNQCSELNENSYLEHKDINSKVSYSRMKKVTNIPQSNQELDLLLSKCGFLGTLKAHQYHGISWIFERYKANQNGVLLADEMGLGKTIQSLSVLASLNHDNFNCLIICPSSLKHNWVNEIGKFFPKLLLKTLIIENSTQKFINGINIISCELSKSHQNVRDNFDILIFDEAQRLKNKRTKLWQSTNQISSAFKLLLTGSPIENSECDLLNLLELITNDIKKSKWEAIVNNNNYRREDSLSKVLIIRSFFQNYILSRNKNDCLDLPPCELKYIKIDMDLSMSATYEMIRNQFLSLLSKNKGAHSFMALDALLRLRQLCSLPRLIESSFPDLEISQYSPKADKVEEIIDNNIAKGGKIVFFSVFIGVLDEFESRLNKKGIITARIDGNCSSSVRKVEIDKFITNDGCKVFLSSLHVGGVGLNLVEADTVILYNSWWNPAVENQAISRVHRMGQKNNVSVYIPIYKNTVEEKIQTLLSNKRMLSDTFDNFSLNSDDYINLLM